MNELENIINKFKKLKGIEKDCTFADMMGMRPAEVSRAKKQGYFTDEQCINLARGAEVEPSIVFIAREVAKEKNQNYKSVWEQALNNCLGSNKD